MSIHERWSSRMSLREMNDALEAHSSFQHAKSLFFWLILIFLVVQAGAFWLVDLDKTRLAIPPAMDDQGDVIWHDSTPNREPELVRFTAMHVVDAEVESDSAEGIAAPEVPDIVTPAPESEAEITEPAIPEGLTEDEYVSPQEDAIRQARSIRGLVGIGLTTSMYILSFSVVMYCLCLFGSLQIALVGRLGGMTEGAKAFLVALLLAVIVVPWTRMMCGWAPGVMFNIAELEDAYRAKVLHGDMLFLVKYYGRFVGFWLLAVLLTLVAQIRSCQAGRRIRTRIETLEGPGLEIPQKEEE